MKEKAITRTYFEIERAVIAEFDRREKKKRLAHFSLAAALLVNKLTNVVGISERRAELFVAKELGLDLVMEKHKRRRLFIKNGKSRGLSSGRYPGALEHLAFFRKVRREVKRRYSKEVGLT